AKDSRAEFMIRLRVAAALRFIGAAALSASSFFPEVIVFALLSANPHSRALSCPDTSFGPKSTLVRKGLEQAMTQNNKNRSDQIEDPCTKASRHREITQRNWYVSVY